MSELATLTLLRSEAFETERWADYHEIGEQILTLVLTTEVNKLLEELDNG